MLGKGADSNIKTYCLFVPLKANQKRIRIAPVGGGGRPGGRNECEMSFAIAGEEEAYTATFSHIPWGGQEQYPKALGHTVEELDISQVSCGVLPQVPPKAQPSVTPARASLCQMDPANSLP